MAAVAGMVWVDMGMGETYHGCIFAGLFFEVEGSRGWDMYVLICLLGASVMKS